MSIAVGESIKNYPKKSYDHPVAAVDVVLFRLYKQELQVLLLKLKEAPFDGKWAIPGGLVTSNETLEDAAVRHLENKVGIKKDIYLEQLSTFGDPNRDPLGWVVSVAYIGLTNSPKVKVKISKRYSSYEWFAVDSLPALAYDHELIVKAAVKRVVSKIGYTNLIKFLMKEEFTLTELQQIYEILLKKSLDKRNFRKKVLHLKVLKPLNRSKKEGPQRPAKLYKFDSNELVEVIMV